MIQTFEKHLLLSGEDSPELLREQSWWQRHSQNINPVWVKAGIGTGRADRSACRSGRGAVGLSILPMTQQTQEREHDGFVALSRGSLRNASLAVDGLQRLSLGERHRPPSSYHTGSPSAPSVEQTQTVIKRALAAHSAWSGMALALSDVRPVVPEILLDAPEWRQLIESEGKQAVALSKARQFSERYLDATDPETVGLDEAWSRALRARKTEIDLCNRRPRKAK